MIIDDDQSSTPDHAPPAYDYSNGPPAPKGQNPFRSSLDGPSSGYPHSAKSPPSLPYRPSRDGEPSQPSYPPPAQQRSWYSAPAQPSGPSDPSRRYAVPSQPYAPPSQLYAPSSGGVPPGPPLGYAPRSPQSEDSDDGMYYNPDPRDLQRQNPSYQTQLMQQPPLIPQRQRRGGLIHDIRTELSGALRGGQQPVDDGGRRGGLIRDIRNEIRGTIMGGARGALSGAGGQAASGPAGYGAPPTNYAAAPAGYGVAPAGFAAPAPAGAWGGQPLSRREEKRLRKDREKAEKDYRRRR